MINQFEQLEKQYTHKETIHTIQTLEKEFDLLRKKNLEISKSNTVIDILERNNSKTARNTDLLAINLSRTNIDHVFLLNVNKIVHQVDFDNLTISKQGTNKIIKAASLLLNKKANFDIVPVDEGYYLASVQPVFQSKSNHNQIGAIVLLENINKIIPSHLSSSYQINSAALKKLNTTELKNAYSFNKPEDYSAVTIKENDSQIIGTAMVKTVFPNHYLQLTFEPNNEFFLESIKTINTLFAVVIVILFLFLFISWKLFQSHISVPLKKIASSMSDTNNRINGTQKKGEQNDEIAIVKNKVDHLLEQITYYHNQIKAKSYIDSLTGLYNRLGFQKIIEKQISKTTPNMDTFALLFIDIDEFKHINDTYGNIVGDKLLQQLSKRLFSYDPIHSTVARISGDEFIMIFEDVKNDELFLHRLKEVHDIIRLPYKINQYTIYITVSIGVALYPDNGKSVEELMNNADTAMVTVKNSLKNGFQFYHQNMKNVITESDIQSGISNDEFYVVYQPQMYALTNDLIGFEALIRWNSKKFGFVSPTEFIGIAENTGLIYNLGEFVLNTAISQLEKWNSRYKKELKMSINISTLQLRQGKTFVQSVEKCLLEYDVNPNQITLEITESIPVGSEEEILKTLKSLEALHVTISIDDFGKEYSVLHYLQRLPVHGLKIDKSFIQDMENNDKIVKIILALAQALKLHVVAEGVETEDQQKKLIEFGCYHIQGFLHSKPLEAKEIEKKYFIL